MLQELFRLPILDWPIYGYGLMLVIGFLAATQLAKWLAGRMGLNGEVFVNAGLLALISGIAGARLSHILENLPEFTRGSFTENIWNMVNLRSGGLTFYGGFILAFATLVLYARWKKVSLPIGMDIVAPCLMVGLGFGRIGCYLNGCCHGERCDLPWAGHFPYHSHAYQEQLRDGQLTPPAELLKSPPVANTRASSSTSRVLLTPEEVAQSNEHIRATAAAEHSLGVHPAQLYSSANAFLIAAVLLAYLTVPHAAGRAFAWMLLMKGVSRFLLEILRVEPPVLGRMSLSMVISIGVVSLGVVLWCVFGHLAKSPTPITADPGKAQSGRA
jgi:phosphatidylglycerol---prolipoprotein diacylglyceryl transferase